MRFSRMTSLLLFFTSGLFLFSEVFPTPIQAQSLDASIYEPRNNVGYDATVLRFLNKDASKIVGGQPTPANW